MADVTREQLNESNAARITGAGKVTKSRHATHNDKIADYIDTQCKTMKKLLPVVLTTTDEGDGTGILIDTNPTESENKMIGRLFSSFFGVSGAYEETLHFIKNEEDNFITMINGYFLPALQTFTLIPR